MNILVTGSVLNASEESIKFYQAFKNILFKDYNLIGTPLETMKFKGDEFERYNRAMELVKQSDVIIAELTNPSTGQGMELQEAARLNKKVIVISKEGSKISNLIKGSGIIRCIILYVDIEDLKINLLEELNKIV